MREGGMSAQFFGLVSLPLADRVKGMARVIHEQIDALDRQIARRPEALRLVRSAAEIAAVTRAGGLAALLGIEGAHALEGDLANVAIFARRGVRDSGFLHVSANEAGVPAYGKGRNDQGGLTTWGHELVTACEDSGVLVDLAHVNKHGFLDACQTARKPPIVSHTGVLGAFEHWRNIDDAQLRAVADKGGVVGVIFCPRFIGGDGLAPVIKHLKHIVDVVGEDAPALGSDWDGFILPTTPLKDPRGLPLLTDAMLAAGFSRRAVGKILHDNVMRVLGEA
jgi:membrane dipeptidase